MTRAVKSKKAPVINSSTQTVNTWPYHVTDLGDGKAQLQLDTKVPWSTALRILKIVNTSEDTHPPARTTDQT
jgi:hypothetical protein